MNPPRQTLGCPHRTNEQDLAGWCFMPVSKPSAVRPARRRRAPREYKKINSPIPRTADGCGDRAMAPLTNASGSWFGRGTLQIVSAWMTLQRQGSWVAVHAKATAAVHIHWAVRVCVVPAVLWRVVRWHQCHPVSSVQDHTGSDDQFSAYSVYRRVGQK